MKNKRFFLNIDTEAKAYLLGFILGDGCINSDRECSITLNRKDKEHLSVIGKWFDKAPFDIFKSLNDKKYPQSRLSLSSVDLVRDLNNIGIIKQKTYKLSATKVWSAVPDNIKNHFIRGYFDADGYVGFSKKSQPYFSIASYNKDILNIISLHLNDLLHINTKVSKGDKVWRLRAGGSKNVLSIGNYLYYKCTVSLYRKLKIFSSIKIKSSTGYIGISKFRNKWKVKVSTKNGSKYLGTYSSEHEAILSHEEYALKFCGKTNGVYKNGNFQFWKYKPINLPSR